MNSNHLKIWRELVFKTNGYRKNFDTVTKDENIITEYEGSVSEGRLEQNLPPVPVGEYTFSIWNVALAIKNRANINKLIKAYGQENAYTEVNAMIKSKDFQIKEYEKVIFLHNFVLHPNYRKKEITEEFIEFIYRDFYAPNVAIMAFVKPIQNNKVDYDYFTMHNFITVMEGSVGDLSSNSAVFVKGKHIKASEYYQIDELLKKTDTEINEYKLFALAAKCGFNRIDGSHLFIYSPEKTVERMEEKQKIINQLTLI